VKLDDVVWAVQTFTGKWPEIRHSSPDAARAAGDTDGGFERLLRAQLADVSTPGDVSLARELHFADGREGAVIPAHELDLILRLEDGACALEAKAWTNVVDKGPVIVFVGKLLDFLSAPKFDSIADSLKCGFISLGGFTEAARRAIFAFGIIPFSRSGEDRSFHYLDAALGKLQRYAEKNRREKDVESLSLARDQIAPYVAFEGRRLTDVFHVEADYATVDLLSLRRAANLYDEARDAHRRALMTYRRLVRQQ